jgi:hypothetical protein
MVNMAGYGCSELHLTYYCPLESVLLWSAMSREYLKRALHLHPQSVPTDEEVEEVAAVVVVHEVLNGVDPPRHRGSVMGRRVVRRQILDGHDKLFDDYFAENPVYNEDTFRRR